MEDLIKKIDDLEKEISSLKKINNNLEINCKRLTYNLNVWKNKYNDSIEIIKKKNSKISVLQYQLEKE